MAGRFAAAWLGVVLAAAPAVAAPDDAIALRTGPPVVGEIVTVGDETKAEACEALGAVRAINYRKEDFVEVVREITGKHGADVILDMVGGDYFARNLDVLAIDGRMVQVAVQKGAKVELFIPTIMSKRLHYTGSTLRPRTLEQKAAVADAVERNLWPLFEKGDIKPLIYTTYPLSEAAEAHALMESSDHIGKIMLTVDDAV